MKARSVWRSSLISKVLSHISMSSSSYCTDKNEKYVDCDPSEPQLTVHWAYAGNCRLRYLALECITRDAATAQQLENHQEETCSEGLGHDPPDYG